MQNLFLSINCENSNIFNIIADFFKSPKSDYWHDDTQGNEVIFFVGCENEGEALKAELKKILKKQFSLLKCDRHYSYEMAGA